MEESRIRGLSFISNGTNIANTENCCGCGCCSKICQNRAIYMEPDEKGFYHAAVLEEKCTNCGLCKTVCPCHTDVDLPSPLPQEVYAVVHKDERIRRLSASGGLFSALASRVILERGGGKIYGAVFTEKFHVIHAGASTEADLGALRGSKYVQSKFWLCIPELVENLRGGKTCMVVGTPCQIHGLRNLCQMMKIERNVYFVDLICHGVPSQMLFQEHIRMIENRYGKIRRYRSRSKLEGWHTYFDRIFTERGEVNPLRAGAQVWRRLFASNVCLQEACYSCKYANTSRVGDLTLGDFWGIEKKYPSKDDNRGCSLVFINTEKGKALFEKVKDEVDFFPVSIEDALQGHLYKPCSRPQETDSFWEEYKKYGWKYVAKKYNRQTVKVLIWRLLNRLKFEKAYPHYEEPFGEIWKKAEFENQ